MEYSLKPVVRAYETHKGHRLRRVAFGGTLTLSCQGAPRATPESSPPTAPWTTCADPGLCGKRQERTQNTEVTDNPSSLLMGSNGMMRLQVSG